MANKTSSKPKAIDGSLGEGGGQILRSSLSLSVLTGTPVRISNIRAGRPKPGLLRQHLTAVKAAARISNARVDGAELGSTELTFQPQQTQAGHYEFAVGTAGSATLVLQTVLPALMLADGESHLTLEGGTHNPWAPPFEFLLRSFARCIERMGPRLSFSLERPGFHPAGGGRFIVTIEPTSKLSGFQLLERGAERHRSAEVLLAHLPEHIGEREMKVLRERLSLDRSQVSLHQMDESQGPGNAVLATLEFEEVTEVFSATGSKGVSAERVAHQTADAAEAYLSLDAPVGAHLADQLLLPFAIAGSGGFRTGELSPHARTNIEVIRQFLDTPIRVRQVLEEEGVNEIVFG